MTRRSTRIWYLLASICFLDGPVIKALGMCIFLPGCIFVGELGELCGLGRSKDYVKRET